jgi:hypothetical protein
MPQLLGGLPTTIPDLYCMEKDPCAFEKLAGVVDALKMDPNCGDRVGFHMYKWTLLVTWSLDTPYLQPEGLETSSP